MLHRFSAQSRWILFCSGVFFVIFLISGCHSKPIIVYSYASPEQALESMFKAVENKNAEAFLMSVTDDYLKQAWQTSDRQIVKRMIDRAFQKAALPPRSATEYQITNKVKVDELMRVEYKVKSSHLNATYSYLLKQIDGEWKIHKRESLPQK